MKAIIYFFGIFTALAVNAKCPYVESKSQSGGYRLLTFNSDIVLEDVESFRVVKDKLIFAISPIYGKPEIGVLDCKTKKRTQIVAPRNKTKAYPDGTDFFRIKGVKRKNGKITVEYFYAPNVDEQNFKTFEVQENLRFVTF